MSRIEAKGPAFQRVCLVGHSHGGNVALEAAGKCRVPIDTVICLSTPHLYLNMLDKKDQVLSLPVFCSPETQKNVKQIVSLWPRTDKVPDIWANVRKGLNDRYAMAETKSWREKYDYPRLPEDGFWTRVMEKANLWLGLELFESGNIQARSALRLPTGDDPAVTQLELCTLVDDTLGKRAHFAVHSRRMGFILGKLLRGGVTAANLQYLREYVQPADADEGDGLPRAEYEAWLNLNEPLFDRAGWRLRKAAVTLDKAADGGSPPHLLLQLQAHGQVTSRKYAAQKTAVKKGTFAAEWDVDYRVYRGDELTLEAVDAGAWALLPRPHRKPERRLGKQTLTICDQPVASCDKDPAHGRCWSAKLEWEPFHH